LTALPELVRSSYKGIAMRARLLHAPLLLLLYQTVPARVEPDSLGRYRLTLGYGGGQWEDEEFDCQGQLVNAARVPYRSGGAQLDAWLSPHLRVTAFGGTFRPMPRPDFGASVHDYYGGFGGAQLAYEGRHFGIGIGPAHVSGYDGFTGPSSYLRIGNMDGVYFLSEALQPTPVFSSTGLGRTGVGFHQGQLRRVGGFFGIAFPPPYNGKAMLTGSLRYPVAGRLTLLLDGVVGPGEQYGQQGAAVGLRYDFGRSGP